MKKSTVYVNSKYTKAYIPNSKWTEERGGGAVPAVDASSPDICVGTQHMPTIAPIVVHCQFVS